MDDPKSGPEFESVDPKPGFRWPVAVSRPIAAPAMRVWEAISSPGNLEPCHPFCAANPVHDWPGETSRDEVHYLNGWVFERRFTSWFEGIGYDLEIGRRGGRQSFVSWRVRPIESGRTVLRIAVYPYVTRGEPVPRNHFGPHPWFSGSTRASGRSAAGNSSGES